MSAEVPLPVSPGLFRKLRARPWFADPPSFEEDERVLQLFRNRAELKKSWSELQEEVRGLQDLLKVEQASTARVEDALARLEAMLAQTGSGHHAMLHFQLRDLWRRGSQLLGQLSAELVEQQTAREARTRRAQYDREQGARLAKAQQDLSEWEARGAAMRSKLEQIHQARVVAGRRWRWWVRRRLEREADALMVEAAAVSRELGLARDTLATLQEAVPPDFVSLSVAARRGINLGLLAYAQLLSQRLAGKLEGGSWLALMAEAARQREPLRRDWDSTRSLALMEQLGRLRNALPAFTAVSHDLKQRIERLAASARYADAVATLPTDDSLLQHQETDPEGGVAVVLADNDWGVRSRLLD
ncbi:MAG: hypothetical protein RL026_421 [Pseudomonadota bacterium]